VIKSEQPCGRKLPENCRKIPRSIHFQKGTLDIGEPAIASSKTMESRTTHAASPSGGNLGTRSDISEIDTVLAVEWSSDLIIWNPIPIGAASSAGVLVEERGTDADLITITIPEANAQSRKLLARLKVLKP
jgi:hypothetical protein